LTERCGIDLDDGALDKSVRPDELVVRGVVDDSEKPSLAGDLLASPREVTSLQTKGTVLQVSTTDTNSVNAFGTKLSAGWLTAELELSLLAVMGALSPSGRTFVPRRTRDTYITTILWYMAMSWMAK
jgi:hypothetical protein